MGARQKRNPTWGWPPDVARTPGPWTVPSQPGEKEWGDACLNAHTGGTRRHGGKAVGVMGLVKSVGKA